LADSILHSHQLVEQAIRDENYARLRYRRFRRHKRSVSFDVRSISTVTIIIAWGILEVVATFTHQHLMESLAYVHWVKYWEKINAHVLKPTALVLNGLNVEPVVFPPSTDAMGLTIVP
jgi:hypothetical protein